MSGRIDFYRWFEKQPKPFQDSFIDPSHSVLDAGCMIFSRLAEERAAEEMGSGSLHLPTTVCQNAADTKVGDE